MCVKKLKHFLISDSVSIDRTAAECGWRIPEMGSYGKGGVVGDSVQVLGGE